MLVSGHAHQGAPQLGRDAQGGGGSAEATGGEGARKRRAQEGKIGCRRGHGDRYAHKRRDRGGGPPHVPDLEEIERATARKRLSYPYIPGLLSFREAPVLIEAFARLAGVPDVAVFDGQGIAHPRGLGLASHMGLWLGIPTIGCAKSRLIGHHAEPGVEAGSSTELKYAAGGGREKTVGACLRTRRAVKPVYISPGHLIGLETALEIVMRCTDGVRIPKPTRLADRIVGKLARA